MKAGRELDALIAEKVMGWKRLTYAQANPHNKNYEHRTELTGYWHDESLKGIERAEDCDDYYRPESAWSPSTDIAAAWKVVEKMKIAVAPMSNILDGPNDSWSAIVLAGENGIDHRQAIADTAPLAICLAALNALGADIGRTETT